MDKHTVSSVMNAPAEEPAPKTKKSALSPLEQAKKWALDYLKRPRSEAELRKKLAQRGVAQADIDTVVALCLDYGFVNDGEYAGMIVRHYAAAGYGPGRIRSELSRHGVPRELWEEALAALGEPDETIDRLLAARLRGKDPGDRRERDKAAAALFRRGYAWEDIRAALRRYGAADDVE